MGTERIRIDDLRTPELSNIQQMALVYGESRPVSLTIDTVLDAAVERTELDDFGSPDFRERLDLWLSEMDGDEDRTALGRMNWFDECVRHASNRLRQHDLLWQHPEIRDVPIERPIIVVGLPRSGTTHLVNLLAADSRLRSMPLWESYEPVPVPGEDPDGRWDRCNFAWEGMKLTVPAVAAMHPMHPDHVHEENQLMMADFSSYNAEWTNRCPAWRDYYLAHDQTAHYAYLKTGLQILQWYRPRARWVLKSPQHLEQLGPLLATFPDATIIVTHRDPVAVVQSTITMLTYTARLSYCTTRPEWYLDYWTDRVRRLLQASVRDRGLLRAGRTHDVLFHEFMADEMGTIERIYEVAGLPFTDTARAEMAAYIADHPRGRDGQMVYDLRGDFDADPADVRAHFSFYQERFAVREEVF